jgi:hypothetical protein
MKEIDQLRRILEATEDDGARADDPTSAEAVDLVTNGHHGAPEIAVEDDVLRPRRGPDGRALRGSNKSVILEVIRDNPGVAAPEIAGLTDLKREVISATIYRLKKQGAVVDYGTGVRIAVASAKKRQFILGLAKARPGIDLADLADVAGLDPIVASVTVGEMLDRGELAREGNGLTAALDRG